MFSGANELPVERRGDLGVGDDAVVAISVGDPAGSREKNALLEQCLRQWTGRVCCRLEVSDWSTSLSRTDSTHAILDVCSHPPNKGVEQWLEAQPG
jgi:hypothetical protein